MVKIKRYKPVVRPEVKPNRTIRRMMKNPTFLQVRIDNSFDYLFLGICSATVAMSGITFGVLFRIMGL